MSLRDYLQALTFGVNALEARVAQARAAQTGAPVGFTQARPGDFAASGEVLIGRGRIDLSGQARGGLCLNNKGAAASLGLATPFASISDLVAQGPEPLITHWRACVGDDVAPASFFTRFSFGVEDASPDSCLGLFLFLARMGGMEPAEFGGEWLDYIRRWEGGDVVVETAAQASYGCLHNALVHRDIANNIGQAWVDGLRLMIRIVGSGERPAAIPTWLDSRELMLARGYLAYEEQIYDEGVSQNTPIQLAIPMVGAPDRHRLVDVYLGEEIIPVGSLKAFARSDRVRPFLKNGFTLLGIHRPVGAGKGNDFTFSADTAAGIDLTALWQNLEAAEDDKWAGTRPSDQPRTDMGVYPGGRRPGGGNAPNQPWYIDHSKTLIGAPMQLSASGPPGTRLSWNDAKEVLWRTYHPLLGVQVRAGVDNAILGRPAEERELKSLEECATTTRDAHSSARTGEFRLLVAGWHRPDISFPALRTTPTLARYLAACTRRSEGETAPVRLAELPDEGTYTLLAFAAGLAVVTDSGAFIIDAGRQPHLPVDEMKAAFVAVGKHARDLDSGISRISKVLDDTRGYINGQHKATSDIDLLHKLAIEQIELDLDVYRTRAARSVPEVEQFREALVAHWGLEGRQEALMRAVEQISDLLQSHGELVAGRRFAFLQTYGLPLVVAATLFGFVFSGIAPTFGWPPDFSGVNQPGVVFLVLTVVAGVVAIRIYSWFGESRRRRSGKAASRDARPY